MSGLTAVLYILFFSCINILESHNTLERVPHSRHAAITLLVVYASTVPVVNISERRKQILCRKFTKKLCFIGNSKNYSIGCILLRHCFI